MQFLALLALLPLLAAAPSPEPYNPFYPPDSNLASPGRLYSPHQLASRAELEAMGREAMELAPLKIGTQASSHHTRGKRGQVRKVMKRGTACQSPVVAPTTTSAIPTTTGKTAVPVTTKAGVTTTPIVPVVRPTTTAQTKAKSSTTTIVTTTKTTTTAKTTSTTHAVTTTTHKTTTTTQKATTTTHATTTTAAAKSTSNSITVDRNGIGPFSGWGTWFEDGLGACGWTNSAADPIVAISAQVFDNWPTWNGLNPNENPICGKHLQISWGGKSLVVQVADRCPGCDIRSLDMSIGTFEHFATLDVGLLGMDDYTGNITWSWVEGSGALPQVPAS